MEDSRRAHKASLHMFQLYGARPNCQLLSIFQRADNLRPDSPFSGITLSTITRNHRSCRRSQDGLFRALSEDAAAVLADKT